MTKRIVKGISFPDPKILEKGKARAKEIGLRSFSEYVNQLIKYDLGEPNYIGHYISKEAESQASAFAQAFKAFLNNNKEPSKQ